MKRSREQTWQEATQKMTSGYFNMKDLFQAYSVSLETLIEDSWQKAQKCNRCQVKCLGRTTNCKILEEAKDFILKRLKEVDIRISLSTKRNELQMKLEKKLKIDIDVLEDIFSIKPFHPAIFSLPSDILRFIGTFVGITFPLLCGDLSCISKIFDKITWEIWSKVLLFISATVPTCGLDWIKKRGRFVTRAEIWQGNNNSFLAEMVNLRYVDIYEQEIPLELPNSIIRANLIRCKSNNNFAALNRSTLRTLILHDTQLPNDLDNFTNLRLINAHKYMVEEVDGFHICNCKQHSTVLESLRFADWSCVSMESLSHFSCLISLNLSSCHLIEKIEGLKQMKQLKTLIMTSCYALCDVSELVFNSELDYLDLSSCSRVVSIGTLPSLTTLIVRGTSIAREEFDFLSQNKALFIDSDFSIYPDF